MPLASLPSAVVTNGDSDVILAGTFTGDGTALTNLTATNLTGTLPDARLSSKVALRAGGNVFSGVQQVTDTVLSGSQAVDQQQLLSSGSGVGSVDQWQSFTVAANGFLTTVALQVNSPTYPSSSPGTIRIYTGQGTSGTLLATESVTWQPVGVNTFQTNALSAPPLLQAGTQYTIRFGAPSMSAGWVSVHTGNPYAGGRADVNASYDYLFKTFTTPAASNVTILMVNSGSSGNVGMGTNSPQARLHVVGDILASGNISASGFMSSGTVTGNAAGLTNLSAVNLTGTVADARLSTNVALLNGTNVFAGTNRFSGVVQATNANNQLTGTFTGNGNGLTNLFAANLTGPVPSTSLTSVPANNLTGTIADPRLSSNVALLNAINVFVNPNTFTTNVTINGALYGSPPYVMFSDTRAKNTGAGKAVAGTINLRSFNTTFSSGPNSWFTAINSSNVTISLQQSGTYRCNITAPGLRAGNHQARLRITTASTTNFIYGTSEFADNQAGGSQTKSTITGQFSFADPSASVVVEHFFEASGDNNSLGQPAAAVWTETDAKEVYAVAEFWKLQ